MDITTSKLLAVEISTLELASGLQAFKLSAELLKRSSGTVITHPHLPTHVQTSLLTLPQLHSQ
jgi:hypothetical protein